LRPDLSRMEASALRQIYAWHWKTVPVHGMRIEEVGDAIFIAQSRASGKSLPLFHPDRRRRAVRVQFSRGQNGIVRPLRLHRKTQRYTVDIHQP